jgi:preprotein translocase subunit SecA
MFGTLTTTLRNVRSRQQVNRLLKEAADVRRRAVALESLDDLDFRRAARDQREQGADAADCLALAVEAARRTLGLTAYDVQIAGALVLNRRAIAEMQTGEGKSLTAAIGAAARALAGQKVHVATVNDYLAGRDAAKLRPMFELLELTVGHAAAGTAGADKQAAYASDVVYATAQELAFDYLRDNLVGSKKDRVQQGLECLIVDEADSILLDEACTPLVLSGPPQKDDGLYVRLIPLVQQLAEGEHYTVDRKNMYVDITEAGYDFIEKWLLGDGLLASELDSLHDTEYLSLAHSVTSSVAAHALYRRDIEYMVQNGQIIIVDEHTGRALKGRRWSDGIHQAIEAKEGMEVHAEAPTLASISYQGFVRLYQHLAGLTGTAASESDELASVYQLDVEAIPTHRPIQRIDDHDRVFRTSAARDLALVKEVQDAHARRQPVLLGTDSVEASEALAEALRKHGIKPAVLNARNHALEAEIIAEAGRPGAVTIATQMAGRGTDILLGGNLEAALAASPGEDRLAAIQERWEDDYQEVLEAGGLYVIGTCRAPSRRVDRQLRGRAGRQGDPGRSCFFLSLEDDFVRTFAGEKLNGLMERLEVAGDEALEGKMMDRIIKQAQSTREEIDRSVRQELVKYDDVLANQRAAVYAVRNEWLDGLEGEQREEHRAALIQRAIQAAAEDMSERHVADYFPGENEPTPLRWRADALISDIATRWNLRLAPSMFTRFEDDSSGLPEFMLALAKSYYAHRQTVIDPRVIERFERVSLLEGLDRAWQEHQKRLNILRDGINLRAYANQNPRYVFQIEAGKLFASVFDEAPLLSAQTLLGTHIPNKPEQKIA